jgi:hypothetical protein
MITPGQRSIFLWRVHRARALRAFAPRWLLLHGFGHTGTIFRIASGKHCYLPSHDLIMHALHRRRDVIEQALFLLRVELAETIAPPAYSRRGLRDGCSRAHRR